MAILLSVLALAGDPGPPTGPYYETRLLSVQRLGVTDKITLRTSLQKRLRQEEIELRTRAADGVEEDVGVRRLDVATLRALYMATRFDTIGAELDLVMPDHEGQPVPVTVWRESANILVFRRGATVAPQTHPVLTREAVQREFGVERFINSERRWDSPALALVAEALGHLSPAERAAISDVPFRRVPAPRPSTLKRLDRPDGDSVLAMYIHDSWGPRIEVYDHGVTRRGWFVGEPDNPRPAATLVMLHELAHAVAYSRYRQQYQRLVTDIETHVAFSEAAQAEAEAQFEYIRTHRDLRTQKGRKHLDAAASRLRTVILENRATLAELKAELEALDKQDITPPAATLRSLLGEQGAPTFYGRYSPEEAFAECFALFHADPAALRRARPAVYEWMAAGGHLQGGE